MYLNPQLLLKKKVTEDKIEETKDNKDKDGDAGLEGLGALFG